MKRTNIATGLVLLLMGGGSSLAASVNNNNEQEAALQAGRTHVETTMVHSTHCRTEGTSQIAQQELPSQTNLAAQSYNEGQIAQRSNETESLSSNTPESTAVQTNRSSGCVSNGQSAKLTTSGNDTNETNATPAAEQGDQKENSRQAIAYGNVNYAIRKGGEWQKAELQIYPEAQHG